MTSKAIPEARRKPALNPAAKVLGNNVSPEVKAEVDKMVGKLLSKGKAQGIGKNEYTEEDILAIFKDEPDWSQQDLLDVKAALDDAPKVEVTPSDNSNNTEDTNGLDANQINTLDRMEKIMGNMTLKQIKILRAELAKGDGNENV